MDNKFKRDIFACVIGNILELYDFTVFAFFASIISQLFFPAQEPLMALIKTFSIFAVGYFMRPIGGVIFGQIGDRFGRKKALLISVLIMAIPTVLIGFLPTFKSIGIWSAIILLLLRILQGVASGGELAGAMAYVIERAPQNRRGFYGSWTTGSSIVGVLLGSLVGTIITRTISHQDLLIWGWRLPFWSGIFLGLMGLWMRSRLTESPFFNEVVQSKQLHKIPVFVAIQKFWPRILQVMVMNTVVATSFYVLFVWMPTYLQTILHKTITNALMLNTISMLVLIGLIPLAGLLSDVIGKKRVALVGIISLTILLYPLFSLLPFANQWMIVVVQIIFAVCLCLLEGVIPAISAGLFPTSMRYSALAVGFNITTSFFGGTAPLVCTFLIYKTGNLASPAIYLVLLAIISLPAYLFLLKTKPVLYPNNLL